jgi:hypothetical protein
VLKVKIWKPAKTAGARERLCKHLSATAVRYCNNRRAVDDCFCAASAEIDITMKSGQA